MTRHFPYDLRSPLSRSIWFHWPSFYPRCLCPQAYFPISRPDCYLRDRRSSLQTGSIANFDQSSAQSFPQPALLPPISFRGHQPGTGVGNRRCPIRSRIARNNSRGIATSAIWKITCRAWRTTFAPILISFSRNVVSGSLVS